MLEPGNQVKMRGGEWYAGNQVKMRGGEWYAGNQVNEQFSETERD